MKVGHHKQILVAAVLLVGLVVSLTVLNRIGTKGPAPSGKLYDPHDPPGPRVARFPGRSVGWLYVFDWGSTSTTWTFLSDAKGDVVVPAGKELVLKARPDETILGRLFESLGFRASDFLDLSQLRQSDLQILVLDLVGFNERDLIHLSTLTSLHTLHLSGDVSKVGWKQLKRLPSLHTLSTPVGTSDEDLSYIGDIPTLQSLFLYRGGITDAGLAHLDNLSSSLEELDLSGTPIAGPGLVHLEKMKRLRDLDLSATDMPDTAVVHVGRIASLRKLDLPSNITDDGLVPLENLRLLEELSLSFRITDAGLIHLRPLKNLRSLRISMCEMTGTGFIHLIDLPRLETLHLYDLPITDAGMARLGDLQRLRTLFFGCKVRDDQLVHLSRLTSLTCLNLSYTPVGDAGLAHLKELRALQDLDLRDTSVTDAGIPYLAGLTSLRELDLSKTQVSDACLVHLMNLPNLENLDLQGTKVTDAGVVHLREMKVLKRLHLPMEGVTKKGQRELEKALPGCQITLW